MNEEASIQATGDHDLVAELLAELRRQGEAILVVEGVVVLTEQHSTPPHFNPQRPTCPL